MTRVSEAIKYVLSDFYVTEAEVAAVIEPALAADPYASNEELAPLVDALDDDDFSIDANAARRLAPTIQSRGFLVRPSPPVRASTATAAPLAPSGNGTLTGTDPVFERLAQATGHSGVNEAPVTIAVADLPVDFRHPALAAHQSDQAMAYDFVRNRGEEPDSGQWHGTAAATLAVQGTPRLRVMASTVMPTPNFEALFASIDSAVERGARIISMSTTMATAQQADRLNAVLAKYPSVLFVLASGNEGRTLTAADVRGMGASIRASNLLVVGASTPDGGVWGNRNVGSPGGAAPSDDTRGSNVGSPWVTIAALGDDIKVPFSVDQARVGKLWVTAHGTSFATPQVANAAGKCMLLAPMLTSEDINNIILESADIRPQWQGRAFANGTLNQTRAMTIAAAIGLMAERRWTADQALTQLAVSGAERTRVATSIAKLLR